MPGKKLKYEGVSLHDNILLRPDTYIGSDQKIKEVETILENGVIFERRIEFAPGLLRTFVEIISNSIDNVWRSREAEVLAKTIKITIDQETGLTTVYNDGLTIPVEKHDDVLYNPEFIFGTILTSSNYDDDEERKTSGRNGYGAKLTNIFSLYFKVETYDPENRLHYSQEWRDNMKVKDPPVITKGKGKTGYTRISWIPDFKRFDLEGYTNDVICLYHKYIYDCAMITKIPVFLNDEKIFFKDLSSYAKRYIGASDKFLLIKTEDSDVVVMQSENPRIVSFVNGVSTTEGGVHVDAWVEALLRPIVNKFNSVKDKPSISVRDVKSFLSIFVVSSLTNPKFTSQSKTKLVSPTVKAEVLPKHINSVLRWDFITKLKDLVRSKEMTVLKKTDAKKRQYQAVEGLDPANKSGGKYSNDCILILCEGLSAKTYAVTGIQVGYNGKKGRDWFGIYPLRGKLLNVRNASISTISKNKEIAGVKQALGLSHDVDYTDDENFKKLRYGKVMMLVDSDYDGYHIEGLIINFFHTLFPSLMKRDDNFIISMKTPILKLSLKNEQLSFYTKNEYYRFIRDNPKYKHKKPKYYKGLGTSSDKEVKQSFGKRVRGYECDDKTDSVVDMIFNSKRSNDRKEWLLGFSPDMNSPEDDIITYSDFLNFDMIHFSIDDCARSIPNVIDGLKTSQRKILYSCFKRGLKHDGDSMKVLQLGGYTSEHTNYPHGESCLFSTITSMAQDFVGSKNIPLLQKDGQFGTRLSGGKDASNARYIFTKLSVLTRYIFRKEDDDVLEYLNDDGDLVEPKYYVPIIPMILVNGCTTGIGTGWSSNIPCHNPLDVIEAVESWIRDPDRNYLENDKIVFSTVEAINPWYRGFRGSITESGNNKFITRGNYYVEDNKLVVEELPIGMWTDTFKEKLDELKTKKLILNYKNNSTHHKPHFTITGNDNIHEILPLHSYLYTSNMVFFDENCRIKKYSTIQKIIFDFCELRLKYYIMRKKHNINILEKKVIELQNKCMFLEKVIDRSLVIHYRDEDELYKEMEELGFKKIEDTYKYLFSMPIHSLTKQKLIKLQGERDDTNNELVTLSKTPETELWLNDLNELRSQYKKWLNDITKEESNF